MDNMDSLLHGDGLHDDTNALQAMLDSGTALVDLPAPKAFYLIRRTLKIHSRQTLRLAPTAEIRLAPASDCLMLENADTTDGNCDVCVEGGIWNFRNLDQRPNPLWTKEYPVEKMFQSERYLDDYLGVVMRFFNVKRLSLRNLVLKDPVTFGIQIARAEYFTIENISFDFNRGNPTAVNMDGVHLDGHCRFGSIRNLQGACYDDLLALNADDFHNGPIEDIAVDGLFASDCHSAVRMLTTGSPVRRITIANVRGTYYQYVIGFTHYYDRPTPGLFDAISLRDIMASKATRYDWYQKRGGFVYAPIYMDERLNIRQLSIDNLHRHETTTPIPLIYVSKNTKIDRLALAHVTQENECGTPIPMLLNKGEIDRMYLTDVDAGMDSLIENEGVISRILADEFTREAL